MDLTGEELLEAERDGLEGLEQTYRATAIRDEILEVLGIAKVADAFRKAFVEVGLDHESFGVRARELAGWDIERRRLFPELYDASLPSRSYPLWSEATERAMFYEAVQTLPDLSSASPDVREGARLKIAAAIAVICRFDDPSWSTRLMNWLRSDSPVPDIELRQALVLIRPGRAEHARDVVSVLVEDYGGGPALPGST